MLEQQSVISLSKRARAKYFTGSYLHRLVDLDSEMQKSYKQTFVCASVLTQKGNTVTAQYCNQRWCTVCNRIRTGKLINSYHSEIEEFINPHFITLTVPNCTKSALKQTIAGMDKNFTKLVDVLKKRKIRLNAIRKIEVTYNSTLDSYHPHYHMIVDTWRGFFEGKNNINYRKNVNKNHCIILELSSKAIHQ